MSSLTAIFWDFFKIINEHFKYLILDKHLFVASLHEKRLNTELLLVGIFLYSDRILRFTTEISVFSPNIGKYGPQITPFLDTFHAVILPTDTHRNKPWVKSKCHYKQVLNIALVLIALHKKTFFQILKRIFSLTNQR